MGKIFSIIKEAKGDEELLARKNHSVYGNLFHLMVLLDDTTKFPISAHQSLIKTILSEYLQSDEQRKEISKLMGAFNSIKNTLSSVRTTVDKSDKTKYFKALFGLLLPLIETHLTVEKLVPLFDKGGNKAIESRLSYVMTIAKAIKKSYLRELTPYDIALIHDYVGGEHILVNTEEPENTSNSIGVDYSEPPVETMTKEQPEAEPIVSAPITAKVEKQKKPRKFTKPVEDLVNDDTPDENLTDMEDKLDNTLSEIDGKFTKAMFDKVQETSGELYNKATTSAQFHIQLADPELADVLNTKIDNAYDKMMSMYGDVRKANFVGILLSSTLKVFSDIPDDYMKSISQDLDVEVTDVAHGFSVSVLGGLRTSRKMADHLRYLRIFTQEGSSPIHVENKHLLVPEAAQDMGINKKLFTANLALYKAAKVDKIKLEANVDVGGYAWFRYGFKPTQLHGVHGVSGIGDWMRSLNLGYMLGENLRTRPEDALSIANFIEKNSPTLPEANMNFIKLIRHKAEAKVKDTYFRDFVNNYVSKCADEFIANYNDRKQLSVVNVIGAGSFKPVEFRENGQMATTPGLPCAISCKVLMSIQAVRDELKDSMWVDGSYMKWHGELDLNDETSFGITKAYLGIDK